MIMMVGVGGGEFLCRQEAERERERGADREHIITLKSTKSVIYFLQICSKGPALSGEEPRNQNMNLLETFPVQVIAVSLNSSGLELTIFPTMPLQRQACRRVLMCPATVCNSNTLNTSVFSPI